MEHYIRKIFLLLMLVSGLTFNMHKRHLSLSVTTMYACDPGGGDDGDGDDGGDDGDDDDDDDDDPDPTPQYDCAGVENGTAYYDNCKTCVGGTTGLAPCTQDCNGVWGGTATLNDCGDCVGGNTNYQGCTPCLNHDFNYGMNVTPIQSNSAYDGYDWCSFLTLATIIGGDPCTYAADYYATYLKSENIVGCNNTEGIPANKLLSFYSSYGIIHGAGVYDDCSLINGIKENKALLITTSNHVYLLYGFHRSSGENIVMDKYDTQDLEGWNRTHLALSIGYPNCIISK